MLHRRIVRQAGVDGARLDDGAARRGQPAKVLTASVPASRRGVYAGLDGRGKGAADRFGIGSGIQRCQPKLVQFSADGQIIQLPAVDDDSRIDQLAPLDPRHHPQHRVLEDLPLGPHGAASRSAISAGNHWVRACHRPSSCVA